MKVKRAEAKPNGMTQNANASVYNNTRVMRETFRDRRILDPQERSMPAGLNLIPSFIMSLLGNSAIRSRFRSTIHAHANITSNVLHVEFRACVG